MNEVTLATLTAELQQSLGDSKEYFVEQEPRLLQLALDDYSKYCPRRLDDELLLVSSTQQYDLPDDFIGFYSTSWGNSNAPLWQSGRPANAPRFITSKDVLTLRFTRPITAADLQYFGCVFHYQYHARHCFNDAGVLTTVDDPNLIILRAQAEAMNELSLHLAMKRSSASANVSAPATNERPASLYRTLMDEFKERVNA